MKPLSPRTEQALRELVDLWNRALLEPVPQGMLKTLERLK